MANKVRREGGSREKEMAYVGEGTRVGWVGMEEGGCEKNEGNYFGS